MKHLGALILQAIRLSIMGLVLQFYRGAYLHGPLLHTHIPVESEPPGVWG